MAAHKNTPTLNYGWKQKIQTSLLVNRLHDNALGKVALTPGQIESIKILLRKVAPDLQSVAVGQDEALGPIVVSWDDKQR
jgi:hypothetical protein